MTRFGTWTGFTGLGRRGIRRTWVLGASLALVLVLAGCGDVIPSTNTYPIDFFSEMHYSKSWNAGEPDGWNPPAGSVPITGGEVRYSSEEAADLENPFSSNPELGQQVFALNCVQCHGPEGEGDGIISGFFEAYNAPRAANLQEMPNDFNDGELFWVVTHGMGDYMPPFRMLLTQEERWAVVDHLRSLEQ